LVVWAGRLKRRRGTDREDGGVKQCCGREENSL